MNEEINLGKELFVSYNCQGSYVLRLASEHGDRIIALDLVQFYGLLDYRQGIINPREKDIEEWRSEPY